jgi:hypothetical protein
MGSADRELSQRGNGLLAPAGRRAWTRYGQIAWQRARHADARGGWPGRQRQDVTATSARPTAEKQSKRPHHLIRVMPAKETASQVRLKRHPLRLAAGIWLEAWFRPAPGGTADRLEGRELPLMPGGYRAER